MLLARQDVDVHSLLVRRLDEARKQTDRLFDLIRQDALYERPIPERHRIVFYIGHLEAFDWNLLRPALQNVETFDAKLDRLFAFGIDPVDGALPSDQPADWPDLATVRSYVSKIRAALDTAMLDAALERDVPAQLLNVAIEHRLMHAETLAYMLHQMPVEQKRRQEQIQIPACAPPEFSMAQISAGAVTLGLSSANPDNFGWDNEFEAHTVHVPAFAIDRYKVTNSRYLDFVTAGGYEKPEYWSEANWAWKSQNHITHPAFWKLGPDSQNWLYKGFFEEIALPLDWPVYVSHAEARAYAAWVGKRLPTEAEWQRACTGSDDGTEKTYPWGEEPPTTNHGYFDFDRWDPFPVNAFPEARSTFGVDGLLAAGWEWTATPFAPFAGFQAFPFYEGYSANFFDGLHFVMKGGSTRTDSSMLRRSFRNWFQSHYQYAYAGFRCASGH